jgi:hypothetical protein
METTSTSVELLEESRAELGRICAELSRMTGLEPPPLHPAELDVNTAPLFIYGILGGKDVGKTTLINALAGATISAEHREIGPGTRIPVAYVHHDDAPALQDRLASDPGLEFELAVHDREVLRHVVLVDLPDFDAKRNLPEHAARVAQSKPHLDAFIWVTTVRKIDHPELLRQMTSVSPKKENFYCVVTFADEVVRSGKDSLDGLKRLCLDKMRRLYFDDFEPENLFVICTLEHSSYEFPALAQHLVRQHSPEEIFQRRRRNALRSMIANIARVREHYQLDESIDGLRRLIAELPERFAENVPDAYWQTVTERMGRLDGPYRRMAARLFTHRIWGWPILSALLFPLSAAVSFLGGRLFFESGSRWSDYHQLKDILTVDGLGLETRVRRVMSELRARFLRLHQSFGDLLAGEPDVATEMEQWANWLDEHDRKTLEQLQARYRRPGLIRRALVYLPLVWFPLAQPVLKYYLEEKHPTLPDFLRGLGLTFVSLLSASYILQSVVVLLVVYALWLLWFYSSSARQVARQRLTSFTKLRAAILEPSLQDKLRASYEHLADSLEELANRLAEQRELLQIS